MLPGWRFGKCVFPYIGNNHYSTDELIFFRGVETTHQLLLNRLYTCQLDVGPCPIQGGPPKRQLRWFLYLGKFYGVCYPSYSYDHYISIISHFKSTNITCGGLPNHLGFLIIKKLLDSSTTPLTIDMIISYQFIIGDHQSSMCFPLFINKLLNYIEWIISL